LAGKLSSELNVLGPVLIRVEHIGSTSVPNLVAKPIIDLMPLIESLERLDARADAVRALGYEWFGEHGITGRRYCSLTNDFGVRIAQLHFFEETSPHVARHLAFRDYLRAHHKVALAYEAEKHRARALHPDSTQAYSVEKSAWITATERAALEWRKSQQAQ
jgi:GrpB-like predicted nucleotidyltransferase (UPF0157 family)